MTHRSAAMILKRFPRQRYTAIFNPHSGFFARVEDVGAPEPFWAEHGPELLDIAITNWCDRGCFICYRKSDEMGHHMMVEDYREVIRQAQAMHAFQVALGGGNPNQHPDFVEILRLTREEYGIVPNYTTNVHFVLSSWSIDTAIAWLQDQPAFLAPAHALVFLNYKPVGRHSDERLLANRSPRIEEFFRLATTARHSWRIGFDTCTITGLARFGDAHDMSLEGCDAGRFSLFVSEDLNVYPCSFMVEAGYEGVPLRGTTLREIWQQHPAFAQIRAQHVAHGCAECRTPWHCLSGCPIFPQMNLCPSNCCTTSSRPMEASSAPSCDDRTGVDVRRAAVRSDGLAPITRQDAGRVAPQLPK